MKTRCYLGVDVGSVSTNLVLLDDKGEVLHAVYRRTEGEPITAVQMGMRTLGEMAPDGIEVAGAGATGSARQLTGVMVGADVVKNEITAHAVGASHVVPKVRTVLEIGGQDSKIIILRDGVVMDFAMNSVCAAGTGSFLDQQAARLKIPIEEFGTFALRSTSPVRIGGRCGVFAESDMLHKQQLGHSKEDIIAGLCEALVRNYLNNVGRGKEILPPVVFQGGVAANAGIKAAFEKALGCEATVPRHFNVMGAVGAALLAQDYARYNGRTKFKGFAIADLNYHASSFVCQDCSNQCEVVRIHQDEEILAMWGDRCSKWSQSVKGSLNKV
jgi:predicted CoA-substrate-specific enzyme activase